MITLYIHYHYVYLCARPFSMISHAPPCSAASWLLATDLGWPRPGLFARLGLQCSRDHIAINSHFCWPRKMSAEAARNLRTALLQWSQCGGFGLRSLRMATSSLWEIYQLWAPQDRNSRCHQRTERTGRTEGAEPRIALRRSCVLCFQLMELSWSQGWVCCRMWTVGTWLEFTGIEWWF